MATILSSSVGDGHGSSGGHVRANPSSTSNITLADLTACVRRTSGERPPPLVGCSLTLVGDQIYVFGGRLVPTRTMVSTLYSLSLRTLDWTRHWPPPSPEDIDNTGLDPHPDGPVARYFHSAEAWGSKIVIFGGEGYSPVQEGESVDQVPLRTLGDLLIWDTLDAKWEFPQVSCADGVEPPAPRYAHLGVVTTYTEEKRGGFEADGEDIAAEKSLLIIMGGQDIRNTYLHTVNVLDLDEMKWVRVGKWDRHIGTYRAVATAGKWTVVPGGTLLPTSTTTNSETAEDDVGNGMGLQKGEGLIQLSYSEKPSKRKPEPLLVFSNFNFTQVRRDLDVLSSPSPPDYPLEATPLSSLMAGIQLPPGLRFPTGTVVGRHMLVFGTYLSHTINTFSIWALDLGPAGGAGVHDMLKEGKELNWSRVDPGNVLSKGSWNRAVGWKNSVVVLGDRERDIATDYDHRQTNFTHVAFVDLEAFGIYQPPPQTLPPLAQSFGLLTLSQPFLADFEIICSDGARLGCSRKILDDRWPWFRERMDDFKARAKGILATQKKRLDQNPTDFPAADVTPSAGNEHGDEDALTTRTPTKSSTELRLTPRTLNLPEASPVVQGFLQYLYTLTLCTQLQLSLPVLSALLVFSKNYEELNLRALVVHALHEALNKVSWTAGGIYEAATLGGCTALQIRALRIMISTPRGTSRKAGGEPTEGTTTPGTSTPASIGTPSSINEPVASNSQHRGSDRLPQPPVAGVLANRPPRLSSSLFHRRTLSEASACISRTSSVPPRSQLRERPLSPSQVPIPASPPAVAGVSLPLPSLPPTRLPNDRVSIPIPDDDLAHVPVPVWSPLPASDTALCTATSVTPTRPPRRSVSPALILARSASVSSRSTVGYFDALPGLLSDDSAGESDGEDSFGLPKSTSTMRSFSGSRHSFAEQVIPTRLRVPHGIEPPVEEVDEPSSAPTSPSTRPPTPFAYNPTKPKSRPSSICSNNSPSSPAHSNRLSRGSYKSNKSKSKPKRLDGEPGWRPSGIGFLDTCKVGDPNYSPLSLRKATFISPDAMASLDNLVFQSPKAVSSAPPTTTLFGSSPRKAPSRPRTAPDESSGKELQSKDDDRWRFSLDLRAMKVNRQRLSTESRRSKILSPLSKVDESEAVTNGRAGEGHMESELDTRPSCDSTRVMVSNCEVQEEGELVPVEGAEEPLQPTSISRTDTRPEPHVQRTIIIPLRPTHPIPPLPPSSSEIDRESPRLSGRLVGDQFGPTGITFISVSDPESKASMCASVHSAYSIASTSVETEAETSSEHDQPEKSEGDSVERKERGDKMGATREHDFVIPVLDKETKEKDSVTVVSVYPASIDKDALFVKAASVTPRPLSFFRARQAAALAKRVQREAEVALGAQLLRVAGASEEEVALRARSVGYAMLKRKEKEDLNSKRQEKDRRKEERLNMLMKVNGEHGGKRKLKNGDPIRYEGGVPLVSCFSIDD